MQKQLYEVQGLKKILRILQIKCKKFKRFATIKRFA